MYTGFTEWSEFEDTKNMAFKLRINMGNERKILYFTLKLNLYGFLVNISKNTKTLLSSYLFA